MVRHGIFIAIASTSLISLGCGVEGPTELPYPYDPDDGGSYLGGEGGDVGQGASGPTTGAGASGAGSTSGAGGAPPTTSSSSTGIGTASASAGATGGGATGTCTPDGDDDACFICAKQQCCPEVEACVGDPSCSCWVQCVADTLGDVTPCAGQCGLPGGAILDLLDCAGVGCQAECGL